MLGSPSALLSIVSVYVTVFSNCWIFINERQTTCNSLPQHTAASACVQWREAKVLFYPYTSECKTELYSWADLRETLTNTWCKNLTWIISKVIISRKIPTKFFNYPFKFWIKVDSFEIKVVSFWCSMPGPQAVYFNTEYILPCSIATLLVLSHYLYKNEFIESCIK